MSIKIDLSKFKHVKSDKHSATLQHKDGHVLTIAIAAMKPEHQEQLKLMAKGGDVLASEEDKKGVSTQGKDVRHAHKAKRRGDKEEHAHAMDYAKEEAKGRIEMERHNKPNIKGLAKGGDVTKDPSQGFDFKEYAQERDEDSLPASQGLPCLNPNCKSHGAPHPNCRCYSGSGWNRMAEGGEVDLEGMDKHFCVGKQAHHPSCEYYADGGEIPRWDNVSSPVSAPGAAVYPADVHNKKSPEQRDAEQKAADQQRAAQDASFHAQHPQKSEFDDSGYTTVRSAVDEGYAKGGKVHISDEELDARDRKQGHEVKRQQEFFKHTESGKSLIKMANEKADKIRDHKAEGGKVDEKSLDYHKLMAEKKAMNHKENNQPVKRKRYADGSEEPVSENDQAPYFLRANENVPETAPEQPNLGMPDHFMKQGEESQAPQQDMASQQPQQEEQPQAQPEVPEQRFNNAELGRADNNLNNPDAQSNPLQRFADYKNHDMTNLTQQDKEWENDLRNGHITPETYGDLFAKKSTLGKIGSLFGLLIGGAGAGLSHQPNALLEMMNNEIRNDLDAQKTSKTNAHNFLQLSQNHLLQEAQAKHLNAETATKAYALANMRANKAALHSLVDMTNRLPPGSPQRQAAEQQLALVSQAVQSENFNLADRAATASAYYKMLGVGGQGQPQGQQGEQAFQQQQKGKMMLGPEGEKMANFATERHVPGIPGQSSVPINGADREAITSGTDFDKKLGRFIDWTKKHSGDLKPADINTGRTLAAELQGAYRMATHGGVYKEGEQNFISKLIDEDPTKFLNNIRVLPQLKALQNEHFERMNNLVQSKGFQGYPVTVNDKQYIRQTINGKKYLVPVK